MPKPLALFLLSAAVLVAAVVFWPSTKPPAAVHYAAVLDWSDSMPADVDFFVDAVRTGIVEPLHNGPIEPGATVDLFVVGANSLTEPFHLEIPPLGGSLASDTDAKQKLAAAEPAILSFVRVSLSGTRATATALLETLPRLPIDRDLRILVISDAKQASAKTINLEKTKITPVNKDVLVRTAMTAIGPLDGRLVGAQIQFRLPALPPGVADRSVNDAAALESFWRAFLRVAAPQARLISFDSRIVPWKSSPMEGNNDGTGQ